ncbi:transglycosylase SLT domain-containing protein [Streptosporangium sp. NPDC002721]|uniref:lytic transglycosylase domain-containing protein n=1 Tax=Streptosporangium sp. NPDC002721 TaxID=3366188 RepID=UPI00369B8DB7
MNDQHAEVSPPGRGHRPGGPATPARPEVSEGGSPGTRTGSPGTRTGRSRGRPVVASLVGLVVAISGCATSQSDASQNATSQSEASRGEAARSATSQGAPSQNVPSQGDASRSAAPATPAPEREPLSATDPAGQTPAGQAAPALPAPDAAIPSDPSRLARALTGTTAQLRLAIDTWRREGDPAKGQPPEPVVLLALHQQRIYRHLVLNPKVAARTYARLPKALAAEARDNVTAGRGLRSLVKPISGAAKFRVQPAKPADFLLGHFRYAERKFGVDWEVLAAVMFVETKFGRVRSPSHTGAKGPMQFMPRTWDAYGMGGDIQDTRDSLLAAANYLRASGAPRDYRRALYAYNHSYAYVDAVQLHARQIKRDIRNYYAYYNWQVFVVTTRGDRRLTGP